MTDAFRRALLASTIVLATIVLPVRAGHAFVARPCATSGDHVAIVVDTGAGVTAACVPVKSGDNGLSLLMRRASQLGTPAPRINGDGFVCAIDGVPATGCGEDSGAKAYWSYWHGDGGWSYESLGAGTTRLDASIVEGWRFESTSGAKDAPRGSASASATCTPSPPPTVAPLQQQPAGNQPPRVARPGATSTGPVPGSQTNPSTAAGAPSSTTPTSRSTTSSTPASLYFGNDPPSPIRHTSRGGAPVGLFVGLALVALLATAGVIVARRRSSTTS